MNHFFAKCRSRGISALLAICILAGGFSVMNGLCTVPGPQHPEIALDVCHPLQSFNLTVTQLVAPPTSFFSFPAPSVCGLVTERQHTKFNNLNPAPDPPPPKALA